MSVKNTFITMRTSDVTVAVYLLHFKKNLKGLCIFSTTVFFNYIK